MHRTCAHHCNIAWNISRPKNITALYHPPFPSGKPQQLLVCVCVFIVLPFLEHQSWNPTVNSHCQPGFFPLVTCIYISFLSFHGLFPFSIEYCSSPIFPHLSRAPGCLLVQRQELTNMAAGKINIPWVSNLKKCLHREKNTASWSSSSWWHLAVVITLVVADKGSPGFLLWCSVVPLWCRSQPQHLPFAVADLCSALCSCPGWHGQSWVWASLAAARSSQ